MRLVIVSHTPHYRRAGEVVGWSATVREIDRLASLFDEVVHVAPLHDGAAPGAVAPYTSAVRLRFVRPAGGEGWRGKLGALAHTVGYARAIRSELRGADAVHVRCPANISLVALAVLAVRRSPSRRWYKYAGNWRPAGREAVSYRLQRLWLERMPRWHRGRVTVNGHWPDQPAHVVTFANPTLTAEELERAGSQAGGKTLGAPIRLVYAGRLDEAKGVMRALEVVARLHKDGDQVMLDVAGDGPGRPVAEAFVADRDLTAAVQFHGWVTRPELDELYARAHLLLLPTAASEGFPKVIAEAMAFGVVPVVGDVSSIRQVLTEAGCGTVVASDDIEGFGAAVHGYAADPDRWRAESERGVRAGTGFTYERYLDAVAELLSLPPTVRTP